ncbi:hypothetical protein UR09_06235 [Candidatus Nitromaritima sp. SCGC AAA799-A02]|nr:hypothetical protein UR09_06235 [Candidatus Nitromaritima sp. SCGC AAA799-A02]
MKSWLYTRPLPLLGILFLSGCATTSEVMSMEEIHPVTDFIEADFSSFVDSQKVEFLDKKTALNYLKIFELPNIKVNQFQMLASGSIITGIKANENGIIIQLKQELIEKEKIKFYWIPGESKSPKLVPYDHLGLIIGRSKNRTMTYPENKIKKVAMGDLRSPLALYIGELGKSGSGFTGYWLSVHFNGREYQQFKDYHKETYGFIKLLNDAQTRRWLDMDEKEYTVFMEKLKERLMVMSDLRNGVRLAEALMALGAHLITPPWILRADSLTENCETWRHNYKEAMDNCQKMFWLRYHVVCSPLFAINISYREDCSLESESR